MLSKVIRSLGNFGHNAFLMRKWGKQKYLCNFKTGSFIFFQIWVRDETEFDEFLVTKAFR